MWQLIKSIKIFAPISKRAGSVVFQRPNSNTTPLRVRLICLLFLLLTFTPGVTQDLERPLCSTKLEQAKTFFNTGLIDTAFAELSFDFLAKCKDMEVIDIYRQLILIHLEKDELNEAKISAQGLLTYFPDFVPLSDDDAQFKNLISGFKRERNSQQVGSVSKKSETIEETPASVIVITSEEIISRGYQDLEELIHDLPGFDISKTRGAYYSNIYQRGFRSINTDRTMFLIDGVEENDLWTNVVYLSRQYPIANIKRVEVIYGPASTMYGANAFLGVINVITKAPFEMSQGKPLAIHGFMEGGSMKTRFGEAHISGTLSKLSFSLSTRYFQSDEIDLSDNPKYDFKLSESDNLKYYQKTLTTRDTAIISKITAISNWREHFNLVNDSLVLKDTSGFLRNARNSDSAALSDYVGGRRVGFSNHTEDFYIYGKLKTDNIQIGFQTWRREEGAGVWGDEFYRAGSKNGSVWIPKSTFFYLNYNMHFWTNWKLYVNTNFKSHELDAGSGVINFNGYHNKKLGVLDLIAHEKSTWKEDYRHINSKQFRGELKSVYIFPSKHNFHFQDIVTGVDYRNSFIPGDYYKSSASEDASETGQAADSPGGNYFSQIDFGVFSQASFKLLPNIKADYGLRLDHNKVRNTGGFGSILNHRAALISQFDGWYIKLIFSQAFKAPSNWEKFSTTGDRKQTNPDLEPEHVNNFELATDKNIGRWGRLKGSLYYARYSNVIQQIYVPKYSTNMHESLGESAIFGGFLDWKIKFKQFLIFGNYTYTLSESTDKGITKPMGDIASHQANLGISAAFFKKLDLNIRSNFVGEKETGANTTVSSNPLNKIDPYLVFNGTATFQFFPYLSLSLKINNILNDYYFHPGIRAANNKPYPQEFLQARRSFYLRLSASL